MRIISGKYKGKHLEGFNIEGTRPTMDRMKESLFATIQMNLEDAICLDLFAGSGSLGIEAMSNGAKCCYFVDNSTKIIPILERNLKLIPNTILLKRDYVDALSYFHDHSIQFDLIFLDPPYSCHFINRTLDLIHTYHLLNEGGLVICEYESEAICRKDFKLVKEKKYGKSYIKIYERY